MITIIGTGHVFDISQGILSVFDEKQPDIICVELDKQRYNALVMRRNNPEAFQKARKNTPFIYRLLARFQDSMAKEYGVEAGDEMMTAINYAQSRQLPVAFIDLNARYMFARMLKSMSFSEKIKLMISGFSGFFISKKRVEKELKKHESNFDKYIGEIGDKFPTIKRVLIDERNEYMVNQLVRADEEYDKIVAVMGDGHIPGISEILKLKDLEFQTVRLSDLRKEANVEHDNVTGSFSFEYRQL